MTNNHCTISVYRKGVYVPEESLKRFYGLQFTTLYPAGLYGTATFSLPVRPPRQLLIRGNDFVKIKVGSALAFEGVIDYVTQDPSGGNGGTQVEVIGMWGKNMERQGVDKRWVENRLTEDVWVYDLAQNGAELCQVDRQNRLRFTPKAEAWTNGMLARLVYTLQTGETIKRITFDYDMQEAGQAWELRVRDVIGSANLFSTTASGTGSQDITLGTPRLYIALDFISRAAQTPPSDGTIYGEISNVRVYSETGNINLYEVCNDIRGYVGLSADTSFMNSGTMTFDLAPNFITNGFEYYAAIIQRAAGFGNTTGTPVAFGIKPSSFTSDGEPGFFLETRPELAGDPTDPDSYDYQVSTRTAQVPSLRYDYGSIANYIIVTYNDENNIARVLTPDDYADLTDADSVDAYGYQMKVVNAGNTSEANALAFGVNILTRYKDPLVSVSGPIVVREYLRTSGGAPIPVALVTAGKTLRITDYKNVMGLITQTSYDHTARTVSISLGEPDDLSTWLARVAL